MTHPFVQPRSLRHPTHAPAATPFERAVRLMKAILQAADAAGMDGAKLQLLAVELQTRLFDQTADSSRIAALLDAAQLQTVKEAVSALLDSPAGSGLRLLRFKDCSQTGTACLRRPAGILLPATDGRMSAAGNSPKSHPSGIADSRRMLPAQQSAAVPEVPTSPQAACAPSAATAESENLNPTAEDAAVLSELVNSMALDAAGADRMEQAAAGYVRADTCSLVRIGSVNLKGHGLRRAPSKRQGASGTMFDLEHTPALQAAGMDTRQLLAADDKENMEGVLTSPTHPQQQQYDVSLVNLGASFAALQQSSRSQPGAAAVDPAQQAVKGIKAAAHGLAATTRSSAAVRSSSAALSGVAKAKPAYFFFCDKERPDLQAKQPGLKLVDYSKVLSEKWKKLSAADKLPYEEAADADKQRVKAEAAAKEQAEAAAPVRASRVKQTKHYSSAAPSDSALRDVWSRSPKRRQYRRFGTFGGIFAPLKCSLIQAPNQCSEYCDVGAAAAEAAEAAYEAAREEVAQILSPAFRTVMSQQAWAAACLCAAADSRPRNITLRPSGGYQVKFEAAARPGCVHVGVYSNLQRAMYARAVSALAIYGTSGRVPILLDSSVFTKQEVDAACAHWDKTEVGQRVKANLAKELAAAAAKAAAKASKSAI